MLLLTTAMQAAEIAAGNVTDVVARNVAINHVVGHFQASSDGQ
jgi:hypothetical protein